MRERVSKCRVDLKRLREIADRSVEIKQSHACLTPYIERKLVLWVAIDDFGDVRLRAGEIAGCNFLPGALYNGIRRLREGEQRAKREYKQEQLSFHQAE